MQNDPDDRRQYKVVINVEEQYSIVFADRQPPAGWREEGKIGTKEECLRHIEEAWVDMRPLSVRQAIEGGRANSQP
jgi:MbtH protein